MATKSNPIKSELIDELLSGGDPKTLFESEGLLDELKKALTGAWYETLSILNTPGPKRDEMVAFMAKNSGVRVCPRTLSVSVHW